jgi:NAD(P)-dependent dehydrogenase (short-subunit alcohol dehydrogenase family)
VHTHLITAHHALPLLIKRPGGLLVDGTAEYNAGQYWINPFCDLAKVVVTRIAWAHARDLALHGATSASITPAWLRSEMMLEAFGVTEENWRDAVAKVPHFVISSGELANLYGLTDVDGSRPDAWRYVAELQDAGKPADAAGYR